MAIIQYFYGDHRQWPQAKKNQRQSTENFRLK